MTAYLMLRYMSDDLGSHHNPSVLMGEQNKIFKKIRFNTLEEINISLRGNISVQSNDSNTDTENLILN